MMQKDVFIGWGKSEITPSGKVCLSGQFHMRIPTGTYDSLYATAFCYKGGDDFIIWVSLDLSNVRPTIKEKVFAKLNKEIGIKRSQLIISAIHTHTGPHTASNSSVRLWGEAFWLNNPEGCIKPEDYTENELVPSIVKACLEAYNNLSPSGFSAVLGHAVTGHCRRVLYRDNTSVMYGATDTYNFDQLECGADNAVEMLYTYDNSDNLTGLVLNINTPAQVIEHECVYSADFIGRFRLLLKEKGFDIPVLTIIGAAGNISPRDMTRKGRGEGGNLFSREYATELGRRLLNCFEYNLEKANSNIQTEAEFAQDFKEIDLPLRTVSEREYNTAKIEFDKIMGKYGGDYTNVTNEDKYNSSWHAGIINRYNYQQKSTFFKTPVHAVRIGNCAFWTNPFELFIEYGQRVKARTKAEYIFCAQLTDYSGAYLPTQKVENLGGYSVTVSQCLVSWRGGEILTETAISMLNELFLEKE